MAGAACADTTATSAVRRSLKIQILVKVGAMKKIVKGLLVLVRVLVAQSHE